MNRILPTLGLLLYFLNSPCLANNLEKLSYEELDSMFESLLEQGKYKEGIKYAVAGREKAKQEFGETDSLYANFTEELAVVYREMGRKEEAALLQLQALKIYENVFGKPHAKYVLSLNNLVHVYQILGRYTEAESLSLDALKLGAKIFGTNHPKYAILLANLAHLYQILGRYEQAEPLYLNALEIKTKALDKFNLDYVLLMNNLARLYRFMGQYDKADPLQQDALKLGAKVFGKNHPEYAILLANLAQLYSNIGLYEKAELKYLEALKIGVKAWGKNHPNYATIINNLAIQYEMTGRYKQAESLKLEALNIGAKVYGKDHPNYAFSLNYLAVLYSKMGRYNDAESLYLDALKICVKTLKKNHPSYASFLSNLALLYEKMERYEQAKSIYHEALKAKHELFGKYHQQNLITLNNLAILYDRMGNYEEAEHFCLNALKIVNKVLGKNHPDYAWSLINLSLLNSKMGQGQQAWLYAHQAIRAMSQNNLNDKINITWINQLKNFPFPTNNHIIQVEKALACMYELLRKEKSPQNTQKQILLAELAMYLLKRNRDSYINDQDKLRLLAKSHDWMLRSLNSLDINKNFDQAFENTEFHKSALLMEANIATQAYQLGNLPDSLLYKERRMKKNIGEYQAKMLENRSDKEKDSIRVQLNELNLRISALKKQIEIKYPKYARFQYQTPHTQIAEIRQNLKEQEALIEYVLNDSALYIFYIDNDQSFIKKRYIGTNLSTNIKSYRNLLSNFDFLDNQKDHFKEFYQLAHWFYEQLLAPVQAELKDKKHLIIIPDGELYHLPFETFLVNAPSNITHNFGNLHYLIQDHEVTYNYSASLWVENLHKKQTSKHNGELFALAANYQRNRPSTADSTQIISLRTRLRNDLNYLPAARQEVESLARSFTGFFGYDSLANERIFKEKARDYGVIHLAMHGLLDEKFPTLSSLAFTNTKDSTENDFLQAYEISKMELHADLVVLSACQTGYGKFERGNGVASLARAFMYAGVPSLVVSLWQVDDQATSQIMKEFYLNLAAGMNKSQALRQAKLNYIKNAPEAMRHPAYWSPFIQIGNSKPIQIQRKMAYTPWYVGIVVMCLVAGLVFWNRKRIF